MSRVALGLVAVLTLARLLLAGAVGLGDDEAYYWLWSRHPDWSYFDHPGGVAWLIAASTGAFGDSAFAVRLPFVLCGLLATAALWALARDLAGTQVAAWAVVAFQLCPLFAVATVFAAPDMPFLAAWLLGWWALGRADRGRPWWLLAGAAAGLAALCKYHAVFLPFGALGLAGGRLRRAGPWLAALLALALFSPVLAWNDSHGWVSFLFHLSERQRAAPHPLAGLSTFLGSQLAFVSPLLLVLGLAGLRRAPRLVWWAASPMLLIFGVQSALADFKPHWTAGAWAVLLVPAATSSRWRAPAVVLAGAMTALVYGQALVPLLRLDPHADVTNELYGWDDAAARVRELAPSGGVVAGHMYQTAAQLAFALRDGDWQVVRLGARRDQFTVWGQQTPAEALFVAHDKYFLDAAAQAPRLGFTRCARLPDLPVERSGRLVRTFSFWRCSSGG